MPNKIEHQINLVKKKKLKFIHGSYLVLDENLKLQGKFIPKDINYENLLKSCDIGLSTVLISKNLAKEFPFPKISTKKELRSIRLR